MSAVPAIPTIHPQRVSLVDKFATRFSIEPEKLLPILKATAFKVKDGDVTNEQMAALLVVADQYGLNPFTKEIFAFPDKGGIVPVVGVDGWSRIINQHPQFDGMDFEQDDASCTCTMYRKDRAHPVKVTEYLSECKRTTQPWSSHPKRMLRHKTMIQCARIAFSFAGIYDEDEAERIIDMGAAQQVTPEKPVIAMPQSKSAQAQASTIDNDTGEILNQSAPAATGTPSPATTTGGAASDVSQKPSGGDMTPGQGKMIYARLKSAGLTMVDLQAQYPGKAIDLEQAKEGETLFQKSEVNAVLAWIASKAGA